MGPTKRGSLKIESRSRAIFRHNFLIQSVIGIIGSFAIFMQMAMQFWDKDIPLIKAVSDIFSG
jgi:hypothetical protein